MVVCNVIVPHVLVYEWRLVEVGSRVGARGSMCHLKVIIKVRRSWMNMVEDHDFYCIRKGSQKGFGINYYALGEGL